MRRRKTGRKLNRTPSHRKALFRNQLQQLIEHERICTTEAKAKELKRLMDKFITLAKKDTLHARRLAYKELKQRKIVQILFDEVSPQYADRNGGYTRVVKLGQRQGDGARMAMLELVGFDTAQKKKKVREEKQAKKKEAEKPTA